MTTFVTYCSKEKRHSAASMPAIARSDRARIRTLYRAALSIGADFLILSGKFGLLKPDEPIPGQDRPRVTGSENHDARI